MQTAHATAPAAPLPAATAAGSPYDALMTLIHVILVEDDPGFGDALCHVVEDSPGMRLAGRAVTRAEGLALLAGPPADVLLVDLGLPDGSGIDVIRAAARDWPACHIMVSTNFGDETHVIRSIEAGASGYLLKDSAPARIVEEIRSLAAGGSPISPIIARKVLSRFRQDAARAVPAEASPLSARENEVLGLITKGFSTAEIADLMTLSPFTVRSFVRRIYGKLKVSSKAEAIFEARSQGWLPE